MTENKMREVKINKLVVNIGTGSEEAKLVNARRLIEALTKRKPMDQIAKHRLPAFKIAQGQKIGAYVTLRGSDAMDLAKRLFDAIGNRVESRKVTSNSVSFGIKEYIDISGVKYDPKIGMLGMNVNLSFMRSGLRVAQRKRRVAAIPESHRKISAEEIAAFLKKNLDVEVVSS